MTEIPSLEFINRVLATEDKVTFSFVDPYGHLNTARYLEIFVNHRVSGPEERAGLSTLAMAKEMKLGMVFHAVTLKFLVPAFLGERLQVYSWAISAHETGFSILGIIASEKNGRAKCVVHADLRSVNLESGRPVKLPATLPVTDPQLLRSLPLASDVCPTIKGLPEDFLKTGA